MEQLRRYEGEKAPLDNNLANGIVTINRKKKIDEKEAFFDGSAFVSGFVSCHSIGVFKR